MLRDVNWANISLHCMHVTNKIWIWKWNSGHGFCTYKGIVYLKGNMAQYLKALSLSTCPLCTRAHVHVRLCAWMCACTWSITIQFVVEGGGEQESEQEGDRESERAREQDGGRWRARDRERTQRERQREHRAREQSSGGSGLVFFPLVWWRLKL